MGPAAESTEEELRELLSASEWTSAAEWLVDRYAREVFGLCAAMVRDRITAEDLTQEVFGRAFVALEGYRAEASSRTWLLAIARNRCIDFLRAQNRDPWAGGASEDLEPDLQPDDAPLPSDLILRREEVQAALGHLAEGERALVVLRFGHGLDYRELASAFGLKEGTARMRVSRALTKMRVALEAQVRHEETRAGMLPQAALPSPGAPPPPSGAPAPPFGAAPRAAVSSRSRASAPERRTRAGVLSRLFGRGAPAVPPPPPHPLAAFFEAVDEGLSAGLRARLFESARAL